MRTFALVPVMAVVVVGSTVMAYGNQPSARPLDVLGYVLLLLTAAGLAWLRPRPDVSVAVCSLAAALYFTLGYPYAFWPVPALIAVFAALSGGRRRAGWAGAAFLVAVPAIAVLTDPALDQLVGAVMWTLIVLAVAQPAEVSRTRRAYLAEVERRAIDAERTREEEALRRGQEERLRVARELHDVTSHTVSVIALHAAVAAEAVERAGGPPEARDALQVIRTASREALAEMKGVLGVLRPDAKHPPPGTGQLPELLGATASLHVEGEDRELPPATDLTVYRVVQEALTNTRRHARATRVTVTLTYAAGAVTVQVRDDGRGSHAPPGHGLSGMRERVEAVGGRLTLGNAPGAGFQVVAWLPT